MMRLLQFFFIFHFAACQTVGKKYYIRKDLISGMKAGEYSIYDPKGQTIQYRIESHLSFGQNIDLISYPSKKLVGKLKQQYAYAAMLYKARFAVFDDSTEQWANGTIFQHFKLVDMKFTTEWNNRHISMTSDAFSFVTRFYDEKEPSKVLAQLTKRITSYLFVSKFDMEIFENDLPDALYLLCLAVRDLLSRTQI
ncbi:unnamed protein product [Rotaria magnacalcarata]|uniref:Uncharacterized protein n=2 Tax=Rotaria magnacalcarata TaxID=392030 RepID=A0A820MZH8_9BILA|nr:unnamed protein product [Rotaria magnacalcarata]